MKLRNLCASALVAALALSVGGSAASAGSATEFDSKGTVTVKQGEIDGKNEDLLDPETDKTLDGDSDDTIHSNDTSGEIAIAKVQDLVFGTIETSSSTITKYATGFSGKDGDGNAAERGLLLEWGDIRDGQKFGYTVQAKMTQQFTQTADENGTALASGVTAAVLDNSEITLSNPLMKAGPGNANTAPSQVSGGTLSYDKNTSTGNAITIVTADKTAKEGKGLWVMEFGSNANFGNDPEDTTDKSVALTIPTTTAANMIKGDYEAVIQWSIVEAP